MRLMFGLVLIAGLGLAGFAAYMAKNHIGAYQNALAAERKNSAKIVPTVGVYVATRQLAYGEQLAKDDTRLVRWPANAIPEGAFTHDKPLFQEGEAPRFVLRAMEKDEALMAVKVSAPGADAGLTSRLQKGQRAFAIKVDVASGVSGFLRPGDRVDVYWTGRPPTESGRHSGDVTKLIESGVKLIAIDQTAFGEATATTIARTVTVAATPQEVAALAQAQATGRLSLSLLGVDDTSVSEVVEVDQKTLLGIVDEPVVEAKTVEREVCTIRTRKGAEVIEIPIPCTN